MFSLLSKLCKSKATGLDTISARLLRECADLIADPMCSIFNQSVRSGIFPQEWKCAKVIPLFKEGNHSDLNNYRPISIVPIVAKVFERIIYDQVYGYLTENNLTSSQQSGFRSLHSTVTALLEATNNWAFNIDKGSVNAVVFLDLKKAFDTVDHSILLSKLFEYGIRGVAYEWFRSYLDNRNQQCFVNGSLSNSQILTCGIPQGTILGPLLVDAEATKVRSRIRWAEDGESSASFFLRLEKRHGTESWFSALKDDRDHVVFDLNGIMDAWLSFYSNLFSAESIDVEVQSEMLSFLSHSVPQSDISKCQGLFEPDEAFLALNGMARD